MRIGIIGSHLRARQAMAPPDLFQLNGSGPLSSHRTLPT